MAKKAAVRPAKSRAKKPAVATKAASRRKPASGGQKVSRDATTSRAANNSPAARKLKLPRYKAFHLQKRIKRSDPTLPNSFRLLGRSLRALRQHWKLFLGIVAIYGVLNIIFVTGLSGGTNVSAAKSNLNQISQGQGASLSTGAALVGDVLGTAGTPNGATAGTYQVILLLIASLALIWALRQVSNDRQVRVRDSYYQGMYPLVPFLLLIAVIGLELLPLILAFFLYGIVINGGVAVYPAEQFAWIVVCFLLGLLSAYMICSSIFALYAVTLPQMTPLKALRAARRLVVYRRLSIVRKLLFLPLFILLTFGALMLPIVLFLTPIATWVFFLLGMIALAIFHSYLYTLYKALL